MLHKRFRKRREGDQEERERKKFVQHPKKKRWGYVKDKTEKN